MLIWGKQDILGKVPELLKLLMLFEVLSQVGVGPHIVKYRVTHAKFLMAKDISRQNLVSSGDSELLLWLRRQENALHLTKMNDSSTASPFHAGKTIFLVFPWPHFSMVGFWGILQPYTLRNSFHLISVLILGGSSFLWKSCQAPSVIHEGNLSRRAFTALPQNNFSRWDELILYWSGARTWWFRSLQVDWINPTVFLDKLGRVSYCEIMESLAQEWPAVIWS